MTKDEVIAAVVDLIKLAGYPGQEPHLSQHVRLFRAGRDLGLKSDALESALRERVTEPAEAEYVETVVSRWDHWAEFMSAEANVRSSDA